MKSNDLSSLACLPPKGSSVLCAVSGGADSMCLLHLLFSNRERLEIRVCAAHFEHGIRGEESQRDYRFVEQYCSENGIELVCEHADVPEEASKRSMGIEETARELRYRFLERAAQSLHCDYIATAHNADDNVETILFHLTRGSGAAGLRGIPTVRGSILRPLLHMSRSEIEAYLTANGVPHVEDSSNECDEYTRNKIRHYVIPVLREINPNLVRAAANTAELIRRDDDFLQQMAEDFIRQNSKDGQISLKKFRELPPAISGRVVRTMCPRPLSMEQVDRITALAEKNCRVSADLPGMRVTAERGMLIFGEQPLMELGTYPLIPGTPLILSEAGLVIRTEIARFSGDVNNSFKTYQLKYENIYGSIRVSRKEDADKMRPIGRHCTKTLKSLFLEQKLTAREKNLIPVLRDDKGILAVLGIAVDERCRADEGDLVLRVTIEELS